MHLPLDRPFLVPRASDEMPYPTVPGLKTDDFAIPPEGLTPEQRARAIAGLEAHLTKQAGHFLGYQSNQRMPELQPLSFLLGMHTNNVGDPFVEGNCTVNTKVLERAALDHVARLWNAPTPSDAANPESYWGYVVSMGSTEGNLFGLYNARDYLSGKQLWREPSTRRTVVKSRPHDTNPNAYRPVAFFDDDTHYSIVKIVRALAIPTFFDLGEREFPGECPINGGQWPREVPSTGGNAGPGTVDVDTLVSLVTFFAEKGFPPLVVLNLGSTFKGASDDVAAVGRRLLPVLERCGLATRQVAWDPDDPTKVDTRTGYWIHVDAALAGTYMPFLERAHAAGRLPERGPDFDFRLPFVHSIVTSLHKWPGSPIPGGIYMTRRKYTLAPPDDPDYIGAPDSTFSGSRNALSPAVLWAYFAGTSDAEQVDRIVEAQARATWFHEKLLQFQAIAPGKLWIERTPLSLAIRFRRPNDAIQQRYSLASESLIVDGELRHFSHVYVMQSTNQALLEALLADLARPDAFDFTREPAEALQGAPSA